MIGGIVTETIFLPDKVWVKCEEEKATSKCAIYVKRNERSEAIKPGDSIWWQGGYAFWTPFSAHPKNGTRERFDRLRGGVDYDIRIQRIGFSGVERPQI